MRKLLFSLGLALLLTLPLPAAAEAPVRIVDGDGLKIGAVSIHLWGGEFVKPRDWRQERD